MQGRTSGFWSFCKRLVCQGLRWGFKFPFYIRALLGAVFIVLGLFGFFPILGFWMIPLGILLIGTTIPWAAHHIRKWMANVEAEMVREEVNR